MSATSILVVGSSVIDHVVRVKDFPKPGESVRAWDFGIYPGGKGANQAVAAARLGARVSFAGVFGADSLAEIAKSTMADSGVDLELCRTTESVATGTALITLDSSSQNSICVALGSNLALTPEMAREMVSGPEFDVTLVQLEIPIESVIVALESSGSKIKLCNPAPAPSEDLPLEFWALPTVVTPNEHEVETISGVLPDDFESCEKGCRWFLDRGAASVVITLGANGSYAHDGKDGKLVPPYSVNPIDTVGAGDAFNGALAFALGKGASLFEAAEFANVCAAISTLKLGAQSGSPALADIPSELRQGFRFVRN